MNVLPQPVQSQKLLSAAEIAALAVNALRDEAALTPKPGLVDRRQSGAHHDMNFATLERSIKAVTPGLHNMAQVCSGRSVSTFLRETLGHIGRETEASMLEATNGVNTHRGAIWALGLLTSAAAMCLQPFSVEEITATASALAALPDRYAPITSTHGHAAVRRHGTGGARDEALNGFPHIVHHGLRMLRASRAKGAAEDHAKLDALMAIMAHLPDTCLLYRGGHEALLSAQSGAIAVLAAGGAATAEGRLRMMALHRLLLRLWVSPGGSADLLAATLFLDALVCPTRFHPQSSPSSAGAPYADYGI